jgi:hypothetical protein
MTPLSPEELGEARKILTTTGTTLVTLPCRECGQSVGWPPSGLGAAWCYDCLLPRLLATIDALQAREETERWGERERCAQTAQSYAVYGDARSQNATYDKGWADACFKIANVLRALPPALQAEAQRPAVGEEEIVRILDEELAVLFPGNPRTEVTAIMTDGVLRVLARATLARLAGPETT